MKPALFTVVLVLGALLGPSEASGAPSDQYYAIHLARVADDAYRDWSSNLVVVTSGCLNLTPGEDVIYDDHRRQITFIDDGGTCAVVGVYRPDLRLVRVDQDEYRDTGGRGYLQTLRCPVDTSGEDAILLADSVLFLTSGQRCQLAS